MCRLPVSLMAISTPGMAVVELGQRALHLRRGLAGAADHAQPQPPGDHAGQLGQLGAGQLELGQRRPRPGEQQRTGRGQPHRPAGALEQGDPVLPLQAGDLVAERGLHDVAAGRGTGEVQLLGDGDEVLQLPNIHRFP